MSGDSVTLRVSGKAANDVRRSRYSAGQWVEVTCRDASSGSTSGGVVGSQNDGGYASPGSPSASDSDSHSHSGSMTSSNGSGWCAEVTDIDTTRRRSSMTGSGTAQ